LLGVLLLLRLGLRVLLRLGLRMLLRLGMLLLRLGFLLSVLCEDGDGSGKGQEHDRSSERYKCFHLGVASSTG